MGKWVMIYLVFRARNLWLRNTVPNLLLCQCSTSSTVSNQHISSCGWNYEGIFCYCRVLQLYMYKLILVYHFKLTLVIPGGKILVKERWCSDFGTGWCPCVCRRRISSSNRWQLKFHFRSYHPCQTQMCHPLSNLRCSTTKASLSARGEVMLWPWKQQGRRIQFL